MHVHGIDHVEFYVEDADGSAEAFCHAYGFRVHGRIGPDTGRPDRRSVLTRQGDIQVVFTSGIAESHPATGYVRKHGAGVAVIALATDDPDETLAEAVSHGATLLPPATVTGDDDPFGRVRLATFGDVVHTFVSPGELATQFPGPAEPADDTLDLLDLIDHVAVCVPAGQLDSTIRFYEHVLGFDQIFEEYIEVGNQAMNSQVVQNAAGTVTFTVLEPDTTQLPGQIDEFVAAHDGAGVQHLALRTDDIATSVRTLAGRGVHFLTTPGSYYDELQRRLGEVGVPIGTLRELNVLVDRDNLGELFQIFAQSTHPRRTFFFEVIERRDALTFGSANIKALYQAVERERARTSPGVVS